MTRAKFEELNMDLFRGTLKPVQKVLEDADLSKKDIDEIKKDNDEIKKDLKWIVHHLTSEASSNARRGTERAIVI